MKTHLLAEQLWNTIEVASGNTEDDAVKCAQALQNIFALERTPFGHERNVSSP